MLTSTSEAAVKALIFLVLRGEQKPIAPREIAEALGASPSYMAKISGMLVKSGILRSQRGVLGGAILARNPEQITLLEIVQATQGLVIANYCQPVEEVDLPETCAFHRAMQEVHALTVRTLSRWTLADLAADPFPSGTLIQNSQCRMRMPGAPCIRCKAPAATAESTVSVPPETEVEPRSGIMAGPDLWNAS